MPDYSKAVIYKIYDDEGTYYGSTCSLKSRISQHKHRTKDCCKSRDIIKRGKWKAEIVEEYPCENENELRIRERYYFEKYECINARKPYISIDELRENNKNRMREWKKNNPEKAKLKQKNYDKWRRSFFGELCKMY